MKLEQLKQLPREDLTQQAAAEVSLATEAQKKKQKEVMKSFQSAATTHNKKSKSTNGKKAPTKKAAKGPKVKKTNESAPTKQGTRQVPTAQDEYGCKHHGLRDLVCMNKADLEWLVKKGRWLYYKPCKDCAQMENDGEPADKRILDMATLLKTGNKEFGRYCNCGPAGHRMGMHNDEKPLYSCDLVLCSNCYNKRLSKMETSMGGRSRRRQKHP